MSRRRFFLMLTAIVIAGGLARSFGIFDSWGRKDHYNWGGPFHARQAFCLRASDWNITHGRPTTNCPENFDFRHSPLISELSLSDRARLIAIPTPTLAPMGDAQRAYYSNHPPFYPWILARLQVTFGEDAMVARTFTLLFSLLNIVLVALIARKVFQSDQTALVAAALQAGFLGTIYFGTHVDYMNEINAFFILASVLAAVHDRWWLAGVAGLLAGAMDWPGFMVIPGLWIGSLVRERGRAAMWTTVLVTPVCIFAIAGILIDPSHILEMFLNRILHSHHVATPKNWFEIAFFPFEYLISVSGSHSRLLGPLFWGYGLLALMRPLKRSSPNQSWLKALLGQLRNDPPMLALFMIAVPMILLSTIGAPYVMNHPFFFIPTLSFWALLIADAWQEWFKRPTPPLPFRNHARLAAALFFVVVCVYPFGIFKSNPVFDVGISLIIVGSVVWTIIRMMKSGGVVLIRWAVALAFVGNILQMINYRTEPPTDHDFCLRALEHFVHTGERVHLDSDASFSRIHYCRGIY